VIGWGWSISFWQASQPASMMGQGFEKALGSPIGAKICQILLAGLIKIEPRAIDPYLTAIQNATPEQSKAA
jgi:hypothetical protein